MGIVNIIQGYFREKLIFGDPLRVRLLLVENLFPALLWDRRPILTNLSANLNNGLLKIENGQLTASRVDLTREIQYFQWSGYR